MEKAISNRQVAAANFRLAGKKLNELYALVDMAREYGRDGHAERSIAILDSIERNIDTSSNTDLRGYIQDSYIWPLMKSGRSADALEKFRNSRAIWPDGEDEVQDLPGVAMMYSRLGMPDSAEYYINQEIKRNPQWNDHINYHIARYELFIASRNTDSAIKHLERVLDIQNRTVRSMYHNSIAFAERDFYRSKSDIEHIKSSRYSMTIVGLSVSLILVCIGFVMFYNSRMKRKRQEIEKNMREAQMLFNQINENNNSIKALKEKLNASESNLSTLSSSLSVKDRQLISRKELVDRLFKERFAILDKISVSYFDKKDSLKLRGTIIKDFEKEIAILKQPETLAQLQSIVDECRDGIITRMRMQIPQLKDGDIVFLTLVLAGFSPRSICLFTDIKIGNYYNKWRRLKAKISDSDAPDKEYFMSELAN